MKSTLNIGIDASKETLEVAVDGRGGSIKVGNELKQIKVWLSSLAEPCRIGIESTGHYHQLLVRCAMAMGHTLYVLNPKDLSHYVRSLGRRAKTDRLDAQAIARYVAREYEQLHAYQLPTALQFELDELTQRRRVVVQMQVSLRQSFTEVSRKPRAVARSQRALQALIDEIDGRMASLIAKDPQLTEHAKRLRSVIGFGPLLSTVMTHALTRRSFKNGDAFVAYIGLDPKARDSGQMRGRRFLSKRGPAELRRLLYVAAMSASKTSTWRAIYQRYRDRGLSSTATLVIIARKLARVAFSIVKHHTEFRPELLQKNACAKP
jgi:transposase